MRPWNEQIPLTAYPGSRAASSREPARGCRPHGAVPQHSAPLERPAPRTDPNTRLIVATDLAMIDSTDERIADLEGYISSRTP